MKGLILTTVAALTFGLAQAPEARADHHNHGRYAPAPSHSHPGQGRAYGGYGYVRPYSYGYVTPVPVVPAPVYVNPGYGTYYPQSGISVYGKNFGFSFSN